MEHGQQWLSWAENRGSSNVCADGNSRPIDIDRDLTADVPDDVRREAKCEMPERATTAQLRYLERLLASANTMWTTAQRRWPEAPARFEQLDQGNGAWFRSPMHGAAG